MLVTDYTLTWVNAYLATISWEAGATSYWWTIYIDGRAAIAFEGSGTITVNLPMTERENHSIAIIRYDDSTDDVKSPESVRLLRPTVRWLAVNNAAEYTVYQIEPDDTEYLVHTVLVEDDNSTKVYSWQLPVNLPKEGVDVFRAKVYVRGSWGFSEAPSVVVGFRAGHPPRANTITPNETSTELELQIEAA